MSNKVITGQLALTGSVQQLPSSGVLSAGVQLIGYSASESGIGISVSTNPSSNGAVDGTGDGLIIDPNLLSTPELIPVSDTDALYVNGAAGDVVSWIAW